MRRIVICGMAAALLAGCGREGDFDATGTFEATEVVVSAEATGRILAFDVAEGDRIDAGQQLGVIDTVQLSLQRLQLGRQQAAVRSGRPDIARQVAALREQIAKQEVERRRVERLLSDGAATAKQLDDVEAQLKVLEGQLGAQPSTWRSRGSTTCSPNAGSCRPWAAPCWPNTPRRVNRPLPGVRC